MHINDRIREGFTNILNAIETAKSNDMNTFTSLYALKAIENILDSYDFYDTFTEEYRNSSLPYLWSGEVVQITAPVILEIEKTIKMLRETNSIRDRELADILLNSKNSLQHSSVINSNNRKKELNTINKEITTVSGFISEIDFKLKDDGTFGLHIALEISEASGIVDNTMRWLSKDSLKKYDYQHGVFDPLTTTFLIHEHMNKLESLMKQAGVTSMSKLKGLAVDINLNNYQFDSFNIVGD